MDLNTYKLPMQGAAALASGRPELLKAARAAVAKAEGA